MFKLAGLMVLTALYLLFTEGDMVKDLIGITVGAVLFGMYAILCVVAASFEVTKEVAKELEDKIC